MSRSTPFTNAQHAPENAMVDPGEIERFYDRCSVLMRELLDALATAPDRPRVFADIEDAIVVVGYSGHGPGRSHGARAGARRRVGAGPARGAGPSCRGVDRLRAHRPRVRFRVGVAGALQPRIRSCHRGRRWLSLSAGAGD